MYLKNLFRILLSIALIFTVAGCPANQSKNTSAFEATGSCTLDGEPLDVAILEFHNVSNPGSDVISGKVLLGGKVVVNEMIPGEYKVVVKTSIMAQSAMNMDKVGSKFGGKGNEKSAKFKNVPAKYESDKTTDLKMTIEKNQAINIAIKSK